MDALSDLLRLLDFAKIAFLLIQSFAGYMSHMLGLGSSLPLWNVLDFHNISGKVKVKLV